MKVRIFFMMAVSCMAVGCAATRQQREADHAYARRINATFAAAESGATLERASKEASRRVATLFPEAWAEQKRGVSAGQKVSAPRLISSPQPIYPLHYRVFFPREGKVMVAFVVGTDGKVEDAKSLNDPSNPFSKSAVNAVKRWTFVPLKVDGQPRKVILTVPVRFVFQ